MSAVAATEKAEVRKDPREVVVSVRGLTKIFKDFWGRPKARAVNNVDFDVYQGEVFGLLGPNGSGKSTTVKMLLGLLNASRGHIEIYGHSPKHVATKSRIGYLPEESYLYRYLDSAETLDFFGSLFELSTEERRKRSEQLLEMVGLNQVRMRTVGEFSKGMQRRIGLAQALINDPDLVILDEPTAGLDPIGCREVKDLILALARRGKTVIVSSHLLADMEDVCDRVVIYYGGCIQAMGSLNQLLATPDRVRITMPVLSMPTMRTVLDTINKEVQADRVQVDSPTQNLEDYFLGVIQKAITNSSETSGAISGGEVAEYLRGGIAPAEPASRMLERLAAPAPAPAEPVVQSAEQKPAIDSRKLENLLSPSASKPAPANVEAAPTSKDAEEPKVDLTKANEKLSSLMGKKP